MEMQQQDRFIFVKLLEQWEQSTIMEMKQWVTTNQRHSELRRTDGKDTYMWETKKVKEEI
eukprot:7516468-Ditylum_brightwellii.AAC.1